MIKMVILHNYTQG